MRLFIFSSYPFLFLTTLIALTALIKLLFIPKLKEGKFACPNSTQAMVWFANRWVTDLLLVPFSRVIFLNDCLRFICLRILGAKIHFTTGISSSSLSDFDLISVGKETTIGAWVKAYPHVQPKQGTLMLAPITVGDHCFIGAATGVMGGTYVEDNVFVAVECLLGLYSHLGQGTKVGWHTVIGHRTRIEENVTLGNFCRIGSRVTIKSGLTISDHTIIPDNQVVEASL